MEKVKKYSLIPEGYEEQYEEYLKNEQRKEIHRRFEEASRDFDRKKQYLKDLVEDKDRKNEFKERIKVENQSDANEEVKQDIDEFDIDEAMEKYIEEKEDKRYRNLSSKVCKDGEVIISYINKQGEGVKERFTLEEFIKEYRELISNQER